MKTQIQRLYKTISGPRAIKLLFPCLLLLFSFSPGTGTEDPKLPVIQKEVKVENSFQRVSIDGDISIILTNEPAGTLIMEGNEKNVNRIKYNVKDNELIIDAHRKNRSDELTIYLSAATLKSMLVKGDADISSMDIINPEDLHIWLNGVINVKVKTTGKISIDAYEGYDLIWETPLKHGRK